MVKELLCKLSEELHKATMLALLESSQVEHEHKRISEIIDLIEYNLENSNRILKRIKDETKADSTR